MIILQDLNGSSCLYYIHTCTVFLSQYSTGPQHANISLSVVPLSYFIGTFILWDVDNLLFRLISERHHQHRVDPTSQLINSPNLCILSIILISSASKMIPPDHIHWVYHL